MPNQALNDKERSHQQSRALPKGIEIHAEAAHSRRASKISAILKTVVAREVREIAIAREVGDSVLCHYVDWQTGIRVLVPDSDYPLAGLLP